MISKAVLPGISVVTVCLNCAAEIEKTLNSVVSQDFPNIEYIVVDGCSTDGTLQILEHRVSSLGKLISEKDSGLYDAMNKGKRAATGDYVYFLNAGDTFADAHSVSRIAAAMTDVEKLYFGRVKISAPSSHWVVPSRFDDLTVKNGYLPHHQSIFYPRSFYLNTDYDTAYRVQADIDFTLSALARYDTEYVPCIVALSTLGGFSTQRFRSLDKANALSAEIVNIFRKHGKGNSSAFLVLTYGKNFMKYLAYQLFGNRGLFALIRFAASART